MGVAMIKPKFDCPFCGSSDLVDGSWYVDDWEVDAIECENCKAGAPLTVWSGRFVPVHTSNFNKIAAEFQEEALRENENRRGSIR